MADFAIEWGLPAMEALWKTLTDKADSKSLAGDELKLFKKLVKTVTFLSQNPRHPGLGTHEISSLTKRYREKMGEDFKVWQSYLENGKPAAGRLYWVYGPEQGVITVIGLEPHPDSSKSHGYERVTLSVTHAAERGPKRAKR